MFVLAMQKEYKLGDQNRKNCRKICQLYEEKVRKKGFRMEEK